MKTDSALIEKIEQAVEDGKLTLDSYDSDFLDAMKEKLEQGKELSRKMREHIDRILGRARAW